jgi:predicted secreted protein
MRPNAARAASARRAPDLFRALLLALSALLLAAGAARAGDRALLDVIGFSPDGRYFAFEEFGVQDGSGFPYSNIYFVDLDRDSWIPDTPVRVRIDDESTRVPQARADAMAEARPILARFEIAWPAETAFLLGDAVTDDGKRAVTGVPYYDAGRAVEDFALTVETFPTTSPLTCEDWFGREPMGMALTLEDPEGTVTEIMRDGALPRSRGCPFDYRLYGVFLPFHAQDFSGAVVMVSVYPGGFEGPDRRFIAIPLR